MLHWFVFVSQPLSHFVIPVKVPYVFCVEMCVVFRQVVVCVLGGCAQSFPGFPEVQSQVIWFV